MYKLLQPTCRSTLLAHLFTELLVSHATLRHLVGARTSLVASLLTGLVLGAGCADDNTAANPECGGHGELHGDHCHCDPGFAVSDDESSCVPEQDGVSDQDHDAGNDHDHGSDAGHGDEDVELDFSPSDTRAATGTADDGTQVWLLDAADGDTVLGLEIYEAFGGPTSPGVVDITDAETDYATCGTCVVLQTGCVAHDDHVHCEHTFMPRADGRVHLDAIGTNAGEQLTGQLLGLVFQEVTIGEGFQTEPVADGMVLHLDAWAFDIQLEALGGAEQECSGHGHMHGDHCHCDPGYRLDPEDPTQCIPE